MDHSTDAGCALSGMGCVGAVAAESTTSDAFAPGCAKENAGLQSRPNMPADGELTCAVAQPAKRHELVGELITDKKTNMSSMLLECAYLHRTTLHVSEALIDEDDLYWRTGLVPTGGIRTHNLCPGTLCSTANLEQAILRGMRHVNRAGRRSHVGCDHVLKFEMDRAAGTTRIDVTYFYRKRMVNLAVRESNGESSIVLYVVP